MLSVWVSVWVSDCVYRFKRKAFTSHTHREKELETSMNRASCCMTTTEGGAWAHPFCHRLPRSNIISSHESWKQCNNLAAVAENKLCFLFDWFPRNFAAGKGRDRRRLTAKKSGEWRTGESKKERRGDNMTCGLLQQTIPIKCDIRDRDNIQMSRVNKNSRWVSWTAKTIKCVKHLRESKVSNLMRWNISETETKWEIPERYPSYDASECCFAKVFSNVSSTFEVPLQHCAAC